MSSADPPHPPEDDPAGRKAARQRVTANLDAEANAELQARVAARESEEGVRVGTFVLLGLGLVVAAALFAMLVVAW